MRWHAITALVAALPWLAAVPAVYAREAPQDAPRATTQRQQATPPARSVPFLGGYLVESRVVYPLQVGAWKAVGEKRYDQAEFGASVRYQQDGRDDGWMDLFVYPSGVLADEAFARAFEQEAASVVQTRQRNGEDVLETTPARTFSAPGEYDSLLGDLAVKPRSVAYVLEHGGKRLHSVLAMTVRDMYFVKLRSSVDAGSVPLDQLRAQAEALLAGFARSMQMRNTGACWRELALVDLPADRDKPGDLLASANEGTPQEVWVGEGTLYLGPATGDGSARANAERMGRVLHEAIRGRCVPPAQMNPQVPRGMREMRFEYGVPAPNSGPARDAAPRRPLQSRG